MLAKLMKYDLKSMLRTMFPLWIALFVVSILFGIRSAFWDMGTGGGFVSTEDGTMAMILFIILFGVMTAVFVLNIVVIIQRFWNGLLKDEGYLMFTLPVTVRELILSKAFSAFIISVLSTLVAFLCFFLITVFAAIASHMGSQNYYWYVDLWQELKKAVSQAMGNHPLSFFGWTIYWIVVGVSNLFGKIYHTYAAMSIGHLSNKNRFLASIIAYIGISIALSMAVSVPMISFGMVGGINWFNTSTEGLDTFAMVFGLIVNVVELVAFHIITEYILRKKLNLE